MSSSDQFPLARLIVDARQGRSSRRAFVTSAGAFGLSTALAGAIYETGVQQASAARSAPGGIRSIAFQDGGKTLVLGITQTTVQLDPSIAGSNGYGDIIPINENLFEGLTRYKNGSAEIEPALAESWTTSEDGLSYVFNLRSGVTFHDGTPFDAKAVETNFVRQLDENRSAPRSRAGLCRGHPAGCDQGRGDRRSGSDADPGPADQTGARRTWRSSRRASSARPRSRHTRTTSAPMRRARVRSNSITGPRMSSSSLWPTTRIGAGGRSWTR